jgi:hypothetical protein
VHVLVSEFEWEWDPRDQCGLSSDERSARLVAVPHDAFDAAGVVVEKVQRLCPLDEQIIHLVRKASFSTTSGKG